METSQSSQRCNSSKYERYAEAVLWDACLKPNSLAIRESHMGNKSGKRKCKSLLVPTTELFALKSREASSSAGSRATIERASTTGRPLKFRINLDSGSKLSVFFRIVGIQP